LLGVGYGVMYQVLRVAATTLFVFALYHLIARYFRTVSQRRTAFLITLFGAGLGWILVLLKYTVMDGVLPLPLDLYVAEPNTFLSIMAFPHFIAAALYVVIYDIMLRRGKQKPISAALWSGGIALFLGWQHAYDLIIVWAVLGAWVLLMALRDRKLTLHPALGLVIIGFISIWPALYSVVLTRLSPLWGEVLDQFANAGVYTPPLYRLPILLGIPLLMALYTALRDRPWQLAGVSDDALFLRGWFWISFVLIYLPVDYQIHMLNGWQIPIALFATRTIFEAIAPAVRRRWLTQPAWGATRANQVVVAAILVAIIPTNVYLFAWRFVDLGRHSMPYYLSSDELAALNWLDQHTEPDDVVLSSLDFGQFVPAEAGAHAFIAHWAQTVDFYTKQDLVDQFYNAGTDPSLRKQTLDDYSVDYVVFGPSERAVGAWTPEGSSGLVSRYESFEVSVYEVANGQN
jgi:hypothetical protein